MTSEDFRIQGSDPLRERLYETAGQPHVFAFVFNRAGYIAAKSEINAFEGTVFGVKFYIEDAQEQRCLAFFDSENLDKHLAQFNGHHPTSGRG